MELTIEGIYCTIQAHRRPVRVRSQLRLPTLHEHVPRRGGLLGFLTAASNLCFVWIA
jgi:hypothetical protein